MFGTDGFVQRGTCGPGWPPALFWAEVGSGMVMFVTYVTIAGVMAFYMGGRHVRVLRGIFNMLAAVFFLCGCSHLASVLMFWWPAYWLEALVNAVSATAGAIAVTLILPMMPSIMRFPKASVMEKMNMELREALANLMETAGGAAESEKARIEEHLKQARATLLDLTEKAKEARAKGP